MDGALQEVDGSVIGAAVKVQLREEIAKLQKVVQEAAKNAMKRNKELAEKQALEAADSAGLAHAKNLVLF